MRKDKDKTKDQLISELKKLRQQVAELEKSETEHKRTEEKLKYQLHFDQWLLDAIPLPVFHKDKQLIYTGCNKAYERFLNIGRDQFIGKSVYDIAPKELADLYHTKDLELLQNSGIQIYESRVLDKTSREHNVIFHKTTCTDTDGRIAGLIGVIEDITERKQAEN
ncbi:MAG: PAS domain-containing protein, partial [Smithella sp.]